MNAYLNLIGSFKEKYQNYQIKLANHKQSKDKINEQIKDKEYKLAEIEKELKEKNAILSHLLDLDEKIANIKRDGKSMQIVDVVIGFIFAAGAFFIAGHYSNAILTKVLTGLITLISASTIAIACDVYRTRKEVKEEESFKALYDIDEIKADIDELTTKKVLITEKSDSLKEELEKEFLAIWHLTQTIYRTNMLLKSAEDVYAKALSEIDHSLLCKDQILNKLYEKDPAVKRILATPIEYLKGENNG